MKSLTQVLDEARADIDKTTHTKEAKTSAETLESLKRPEYAYGTISDSWTPTSDSWIAATTRFLEYLADGYQIASCKGTQNSVHYI